MKPILSTQWPLLASLIAISSACVGNVESDATITATQQALSSDSSEVWRPFSADSPWNTKVGGTAAIDRESNAMIDDFRRSSPYGEQLDVNLRNYSIPLYWADATTPEVEVHCRIGGMGFDGQDGMNASARVPIPDGATPDPESDGHLLVVDRSTQREWGLFRAEHNGNAWSCGLGADMDLSGNGERPIADTNRTWYTSHGPRACGFPLVAGLIRPEEVRAGHIDHALVVAYPHIRAGMYTEPASTAQAAVNEAIKSRGIPCGGHIQLDPSVDVNSLPLSEPARVVARALQEYGAFVGDYSGSISLYADNSPQARAEWDQMPLSDVRKLDLGSFRVLELGQLYDNGNAD